MEAVLLYNEEQYKGVFELNSSMLSFAYTEFDTVEIVLRISLSGIVDCKYWKLYNIKTYGVEITTIETISFVILVDDPQNLMFLINQNLDLEKKRKQIRFCKVY